MSVAIDSGSLRLRVTIQGQGEDGAWTDKGTYWGGISQQGFQRTTFFFRYQPNIINSGDRLVVNGRAESTYAVERVMNAEERNIRLDVICRKVEP